MNVSGASNFGAFVIRSVEEGGRTCANGLPLVPPTVRMLGRFQLLKSVHHANLCRYLDLFRCSLAKNMVIVVSEHFHRSLEDVITENSLGAGDLHLITLQICEAIEHLHNLVYVHGNCHTESIKIASEKRTNEGSDDIKVRLSGYALPFLTDDGSDSEPSGACSIYSMSPEMIFNGNNEFSATQKADVWAVGLVMLQLYMKITIRALWSESQWLSILKNFSGKSTNSERCRTFSALRDLIELMTSTAGDLQEYVLDDKLEELIEECLRVRPYERPSIVEVRMRIEKMANKEKATHYLDEFDVIDVLELKSEVTKRLDDPTSFILSQLTIEDAFHLWKISGASCETIMIRKNFIQLRAPATTVPNTAVEDFVMFGNERSRNFQFNSNVFVLPTFHLREKIASLPFGEFRAFSAHNRGIENVKDRTRYRVPTNGFTVIVKEKDVAYQTQRIMIFRELLDALEHANIKKKLLYEAHIDIPPALRGEVWAALLEVTEAEWLHFVELNTLAPHTSDRQLDVDIPRCHQYEDMMTSPAAHNALRRVLKSWLMSNEKYVYWQGCDSLAAPFLLLNFNNPEVALSCLDEFINRYLYNFFLRDNTAVIQEYLAVFNHLIAYVDAELYAHLTELEFLPELYAIPWFLTCFAHVLPMHQIYNIWDLILLHNSSYPLMVGLAILKQLRPRLINSSFNDAILLFSDLPDLLVDKVIDHSLHYYKTIPPSCRFRVHDSPWKFVHPNPPFSLNTEITHFNVAQLREMDCPRMSYDEFTWRVHNQTIVVIDIRNSMEFARGCVTRSINYPDIEDDSFINVAEVFTLAKENQHPICVVWGKDFDSAKSFSKKLVTRGIDGVCVLDDGFEVVRDDRSLVTIPV